MQTDFLLLSNFLGLHGKQISRRDYSIATKDFWNNDALARISFFLFQCNISNAITSIEVNLLPESSMAGIAMQTDDLGQHFYYHCENGRKQLLYAVNYTEESSYLFNHTAHFIVYDKEALVSASFQSTLPYSFSFVRLKSTLIALSILFVILYADIYNRITLAMLVVQISSLLNAAISGILLFKEHNMFNTFTEQFCNSKVYTGCNKLLHLKASMLYSKLSLATFGTVMYAAIFLYTLLASPSRQYTDWAVTLSAIALLGSVLLIIKMIVIRTFCRLCLWIHSINFLSFATLCFLLYPTSKNTSLARYDAILLWMNSLIVTSLLIYLSIRFMDVFQISKAKMEETGSLKSALMESVLIKPGDENLRKTNESYTPLSFSFSEEHDLVLTLVLSTHCYFCAALIKTIVQRNLKEKIGKLELYLYSAVDEPTVSKFIKELEHAASDETTLALLVDWYKTDKGNPEATLSGVKGERSLPDFCLPRQDLPYAELPAVFINGVFIPHVFGATDLEKLLYYFSLPG